MSWINLDLITAIAYGVVALCCFGLFSITSSRHNQWPSFPQYARRGLLVTGWLFMLCAVDYTTLAPGELGHVNALGALTSLALAFTFGSIAYWLVRKGMHPLARQRVDDVENQLRRNPELIPLLMSKESVVKVSRAIRSEIVGEMGGVDQLMPFSDRLDRSNSKLANRSPNC